MPRLTAKDFPQELLDYYDYYAHGKISKREFLNLAAKYAVGGMTALALFDLLKPNYALATQVEFTDPEIVAEYITYPSPNGHGEVRGYLVKPAKMSGKTPAVVVVHRTRRLSRIRNWPARCRFMVVRHPLPMWRRLKRLYYSTSRNWTPESTRAGLLTRRR